MKKSITLIELIIAIALMGTILVGVMSFDAASRKFFRSSERKVDVINDLTFVLEHIHKNVFNGIGYIDDPAIIVASPTADVFTLTIRQDYDDPTTPISEYTPGNYDDDRKVIYIFNATPIAQSVGGKSYEPHTVTFESYDPPVPATIPAAGVVGEVLVNNLVDVDLAVVTGGVEIRNLTLIYDTALYDPSNPNKDPRNNPLAIAIDHFFFPLSQSLG